MGNFIPDWMADAIAREFDRTVWHGVDQPAARPAIDARDAVGVPLITSAPPAASPEPDGTPSTAVAVVPLESKGAW